MSKHVGIVKVAVVSIAVVAASGLVTAAEKGRPRKIVLVAGPPSHGPGEHEHNGCVVLLKKCLDAVPGVTAATHLNGWPKDPNAFQSADVVVVDMDTGNALFLGDHEKTIGGLMDKGVGLVGIHFTVEVAKSSGPRMLEWLGGFYEGGFSTNPDWNARFTELPKHPITRGVKPFAMFDEWYFNLRFPEGMKGITPILTAKPSEEDRQGKTAKPRGPQPNIVEASGRTEIVAWAYERANGGRSFGFTGGHYHMNWGEENGRKLMLNAVLWTAKLNPPAGGVISTVTQSDLLATLDSGKSPRTGHIMRKTVQLMSALGAAKKAGRDVSDFSAALSRVQSLRQSGKNEEAEGLLDETLHKLGEEPAGLPAQAPLPPGIAAKPQAYRNQGNRLGDQTGWDRRSPTTPGSSQRREGWYFAG